MKFKTGDKVYFDGRRRASVLHADNETSFQYLIKDTEGYSYWRDEDELTRIPHLRKVEDNWVPLEPGDKIAAGEIRAIFKDKNKVLYYVIETDTGFLHIIKSSDKRLL